ncbi:MAG: hypothetical protein EOP93_00100 [Lysobacteraceae bacterium]|nr:MAG: hypothetical protein EOP93_00100 [Xanthomonadaceae bacterium]
MNIRIRIAVLVFVVGIAPVVAQEPTRSLPVVKAEVVHYVVDCENRTLPSQRDVGEWTGQYNFSQVYDTRQRLMAEIGHACQQAAQVQVVSRQSATSRSLGLVAIAPRGQ